MVNLNYKNKNIEKKYLKNKRKNQYLKVKYSFLDNTKNQPSKFRTRNWVEINDEKRGKYDDSIIKFKTSMIRSDLCDYSDVYSN